MPSLFVCLFSGVSYFWRCNNSARLQAALTPFRINYSPSAFMYSSNFSLCTSFHFAQKASTIFAAFQSKWRRRTNGSQHINLWLLCCTCQCRLLQAINNSDRRRALEMKLEIQLDAQQRDVVSDWSK